MLDRLLLERKAAQLARYLDELTTFNGVDFKTFSERFETRYVVERLMQLIVDEAIDINGHLILASHQPPPKDYRASFLQLPSLRVCPSSLAEALAPTTGLRNALVHEYEEINVKEVHRNIQPFLSLYPRYLHHVLAYVQHVNTRGKS